MLPQSSVDHSQTVNFRWILSSSFIALSVAHSWVERTMRVALNGTMIGAPGYERAYEVRGMGRGYCVTSAP